MSFVAKWKADIWPVVENKYNDLLQRRPAKQDTATGPKNCIFMQVLDINSHLMLKPYNFDLNFQCNSESSD